MFVAERKKYVFSTQNTFFISQNTAMLFAMLASLVIRYRGNDRKVDLIPEIPSSFYSSLRIFIFKSALRPAPSMIACMNFSKSVTIRIIK